MKPSALRRSFLWFIPLALLVLTVDSLVIRLQSGDERLLAYAVLFDFTIVLPLLYILFFVRKGTKPLWTALPLPFAGAVLAWLLLPQEHKALALRAELFLLPLEACLLVWEGRKLLQANRHYRQARLTESDRFEALRAAVSQTAGRGKLGAILLHDLTALWALAGSWGKKARAERALIPDGESFTYHRESSRIVYAALFTKLLLLEGVTIHFLVQMWSSAAAWILTLLNVWMLYYIWADCRLSVIRPIRVTAPTLQLRCGLQLQADIPLANIAKVERAASFEISEEERKTAATMLGSANIKITLHQPQPVASLLFMPLQTAVIYLPLDQPEKFVHALEAHMNGCVEDSL
ncbi:hypothetical protein [Paenibacillus sp. GCM10027626]|uniref:hypothetical protein n=1 Tax=Paenibacillus sp. GCM10027626 TaxID=3273411 RepID=UPI00362F2EC8